MGKNLEVAKAWRCPCGSEFWRNPTPMERIGGAELVCELCGGQSRDRPMTATRTQLSVALAVAQELRDRVAELEAEVARLRGEAQQVLFAKEESPEGAINAVHLGDAYHTAEDAENSSGQGSIYEVTLSARRAG